MTARDNSAHVTTPEQQRLWRLIVLASVCAFRDEGATAGGLERGLSCLTRSVVWACIRTLAEDGLIVCENVPSGHPSGSRVDRWYPAPGVTLDLDRALNLKPPHCAVANTAGRAGEHKRN